MAKKLGKGRNGKQCAMPGVFLVNGQKRDFFQLPVPEKKIKKLELRRAKITDF